MHVCTESHDRVPKSPLYQPNIMEWTALFGENVMVLCVSDANAYTYFIIEIWKRGIDIAFEPTTLWFPPPDIVTPIIHNQISLLLSSCRDGSAYVEFCCLWFALLQPSQRCFALSTIVLLEYVTCCQSLRFLAFHILHGIVVELLTPDLTNK